MLKPQIILIVLLPVMAIKRMGKGYTNELHQV